MMKKPIGTLNEIAHIVKGQPRGWIREEPLYTVSIDTRKPMEGALFFAVAGERTDGHLYLEEAFHRGAAAAVVSRHSPHLQLIPPGSPYVEVDDTMEAFQSLAHHVRMQYDVPVIGITGSSGKTTTKDMVRAVLGEKYRVLASQGSFNNEVGLPLTLFQLDQSVDVVVVEMGMRGLRQIDQLCQIAQPDIGIITNVGVTHMELLGSEENIFQAKGELMDFIGPQGHCVLNTEDRWTSQMISRCRGQVHLFGFSPEAVLQARDIRYNNNQSFFTMVWNNQQAEVTLGYPGAHNVLDALAAVQCGLILGLTLEQSALGLSRTVLSANRLSFLDAPGDVTVINDCYNANPDSTRASLTVLEAQPGRKVAVLGDMRELGPLQEIEHRRIGAYAVETGVSLLATVGLMARDIGAGAIEAGLPATEVGSFENNEQATAWIQERLAPGDTVLVKGSRAMGMETIVESLTKEDV